MTHAPNSMMESTLMMLASVTILAAATYPGSCPPFCECTEQPSGPEDVSVALMCTSTGLNYSVPNCTESITFQNVTVDIEYLMDELSEFVLPRFTSLRLTTAVLPNACNGVINSVVNLRNLQVTYSGLSCVPGLNSTELQSLDLSNNKLSVIDSNQFRTLTAIEMLNLSANAIARIKPDGFSGLLSLKCLDMSRNSLDRIEHTALLPLINLQHLNLSNNKIEVLDEACFSSLLHLQQLDVSWNRLSLVAPGTLQLPSLARLLLAGNPKLGGSKEPTLLVGTGRRLQTVDASRTGLRQVPAALTHSIRTLRLAGNSIVTVNCGDLDSYPLLQLLDFTSNKIAEIEEDALGRLDSLTILYLTDNKLKSIPHSLPEKLKVLHLENNKIESVQVSDLEGLNQLEVLLLNNNRIKIVREAAFSQLTALISLDLSLNSIAELPTGSLAGPSHLRVLRLAGLNVVSLVKEVQFPLPTPEYLITLDLSRSPGLARQMLADTAVLAAARELQELDLSTSGVNYIRNDLLHYLPQLRMLKLHNNPLNCSELQWLAEWMRRQDEPEYRNIYCASPPELWGTLLIDLQSIDPETTPSVINHVKGKESNGSNNSTYAFQAEIPVGSDNRTTAPMSNDATSTSKPPEITTDTIEKTSTEINFKHEMTTRYIINYPSSKSLNILSSIKTTMQRINEVLKDPDIPAEHYPKKTQSPFTITQDHENATATSGKMSMYSDDSRPQARSFAHPGMLILAAGILGAVVVLVTLTTRITRRNRRLPDHEDIEVSSLPSVTELW